MSHPELHNRMRERVYFERPVTTPDDMGGHRVEWVPHVTRFAEVRPIAHTRRNAGDVPLGLNQYRLTLRPDGSITEDMRVRWHAQILRVLSIIRDTHHMEITCEREVQP